MDLSKKNDSDKSEVYIEDTTMQEMFLKTTGRLNRLRYFKRIMVITLISLVINCFIVMIFSDAWGNPTSLGDKLTSIVGIITLIPGYCLDVRRLQDLDQNDLLAKISFVLGVITSLISIDDIYSLSKSEIIVCLSCTVIGLYMLFVPGTKGENKYGPDPLG